MKRVFQIAVIGLYVAGVWALRLQNPDASETRFFLDNSIYIIPMFLFCGAVILAVNQIDQ
jgi:uncharacterized membrane protein